MCVHMCMCVISIQCVCVVSVHLRARRACVLNVCERGVFSRALSFSLSVRVCVSSCVCTCTSVRPFRKQGSVSVCAVGVCVCL